jgi:hypothetical protein
VTRTPEIPAFATFFLGIAVSVATATSEHPAPRRLARLRLACAAGAAVLVAGGLVDLVSGVALGAACLGLLLSGQAIWLALRNEARAEAWREAFERPFAEYVRHQS